MKLKYIVYSLALSIVFASCADDEKKPEESKKNATLKNEKDSLTYAIGVFEASNLLNKLKGARIDTVIDKATLAKVIADVIEGKSLAMNEMAAQGCIQSYFMKMQNTTPSDGGNPEAKAKGIKFLEENKSRKGVVTTPTGLQYEILKAGNGPKPTINQIVKVHYKGTLLDGKVFDSSYERKQPAEFAVGEVIKGWTEALLLMPVGSKWKLYIRSELAYGAKGAGSDIGPDETLIFEVELLEAK